MSTSDDRVLVVGAAGTHAGSLVPALARKGAHVRGMVRRREQVAVVESRGAREVVLGDLSDRESVRAALRGVSCVFSITPGFMPDEADVGQAFVADAVDAGVRRIVFSSVIHPVISRLVNQAATIPVEEAVLESSVEFTFLHPMLFFQLLAGSYRRAVASGVLAEPWSPDTRFSRVDYRDVAAVAARALIEDDLTWGTFDLASAGRYSRHDVAALMPEVSGRPVHAERVDPDETGAAGPTRAMFEHDEHTGLGREPPRAARDPRPRTHHAAGLPKRARSILRPTRSHRHERTPS